MIFAHNVWFNTYNSWGRNSVLVILSKCSNRNVYQNWKYMHKIRVSFVINRSSNDKDIRFLHCHCYISCNMLNGHFEELVVSSSSCYLWTMRWKLVWRCFMLPVHKNVALERYAGWTCTVNILCLLMKFEFKIIPWQWIFLYKEDSFRNVMEFNACNFFYLQEGISRTRSNLMDAAY